ncbi:hypothetical protein [Rheinheimera metallidurans]|uniref:hypothetical protein n=1 Tax=Rheinheimera metallidurans TaxID=2925781 RepID=UPI0030035882
MDEKENLLIKEALKQEYELKFEQLKQKLEVENSRISERAIDKTFKILVPLGGLITLLIAVLTVAGYSDMQTTVKQFVNNRVNLWLSEENGSLATKELKSIRDRYLIDALTIRYLKARVDERSYPFKLTKNEQADLIRIANTPETSLKDYQDILNLLKMGRSALAFSLSTFPGDYRGIDLQEIFTAKLSFIDQAEKQRMLLSTFNNDTSLVGVAKHILDQRIPSLEEEAFDIIANTRQPFALNFAQDKLSQTPSIDLIKFAKYVANEDPLSPVLNSFLQRLYDSRNINRGWLPDYLTLWSTIAWTKSESGLGWTEIDEIQIKKRNLLANKIFLQAVKSNMEIELSEYHNKRIHFRSEDSYIHQLLRADMNHIYKNPQLINWLVAQEPNNLNWISRLVSFFEMSDKGENIVGVNARISKRAKIEFADNQQLSSFDTDNLVRFFINKDDKNKLMIAYRDKLGDVIVKQVIKVSNLEEATFSFSFDEDVLYKYIPWQNSYLYE